MRTQEIEDALCSLSCYDYYSPYQQDFKIVYDYITNLEDTIEKNNEYIFPKENTQEILYSDKNIKSPCDTCYNNPKNGGTGICHCILGLPKITC